MTTLPSTLDHIVFAGPSLDGVIAEVQERTGVRASPGGAHPTGTANALIALTVGGRRGRHYLELIGPDAARGIPHAEVDTFGIAALVRPTVAGYALHPDDIEGRAASAAANGFDLGGVEDLSRRTPKGDLLEWRLTRAPNWDAPEHPFLIDWGSTPHPGEQELPTLELVEFSIRHRDPDRIRALFALLGDDIDVTQGDETSLVLVVDGPQGRVTLG